ncbi:MAG: nucleoside-diphosphate sugar epimerase [Ignavibacteriae bacterium HGW-Ignavibacteriae-3]|nr:MAG: nucleoside-diphosphate sugar epimerase [Ignavibacteriae bacterium HGW-Ignavibacteriae-3]
MADKKIIAVLGATGAQGGGLVRAILSDKTDDFTARALTRNINADKAKALKEAGADVVTVDIDNFESLKSAFTGAYAVYAVTFFWEHFSVDKELSQAEMIAKAAKEAGVKHIIWSTLEDTRKWVPLEDNRMPTLQGKYKVPHFDGKGQANKFFTDLGLPVTFLQTSFYWDNFIHFGMGPKKTADDTYALTLPMGDKKLPGIAAEDIGKCAYGIFKKGNDFISKTVSIAGGHTSGKEMAESMGKALGKNVIYNSVPFDTYRGFGFPGADDLGNMFQFTHDFEEYFCGVRDMNFSRSINPELKSFDNWLSENKDRIPLE